MNGMFAILALIIGFLLVANPDHVDRSSEAKTHEAARRYAVTKKRAAQAEFLPRPTFEAARWRAWLDSLEHD
jgi:hypothetical protein